MDRAVPKEKVSALKDIVNGLGADRGLLMSEKGFQPGAVHLAAAKNMTLSSLDELRTYGPAVPHLLPALAGKLTEDDRTGFAQRPAAVEFREGVAELASRIGDISIGDLAPSGLDALGMYRAWKEGVDPAAGSETASVIGHLTQALSQGRLGDWPVLIKAPDEPKLAWSMPQLLGVVESGLALLEQQVDEQEARAR